jgi:Cytosine/adenosine deaminases
VFFKLIVLIQDNMTDEYYMTQALKEAKKAFDEDEVPLALWSY